jgi:stage II sporulation protein AA (anti-sigma F factor antagonist)
MNEQGKLLDVTRHEGVVVVTPRSDLRELDFQRIQEEFDALLDDPGVRRVVVDLAHTDVLGSTALGMLVRLGQALGRRDGRLVLCNVSAHEREIFGVVGLGKAWVTAASLAEALRAVAD